MARPKNSKNPHAVALGRLGGKAAAGAGAKVQFAAMTLEERRRLAKRAAKARWAKRRKVLARAEAGPEPAHQGS